MKKFSTLAFMAFFFCLSAMAQVELGEISFSLGEGKKINPNNGKITVTFPNVTGIGDPTATTFVVEGNFGNDDTAFDGVEGTFAEGVTFELQDFGLEPATDYTLSITSVKVGGAECAAEGGYALNFKTRDAERKMSWIFTIDEESVEKIKADDGNVEGGAGAYWSVIGVDQRHYYHIAMNNEEMMLDATTPLPMTEDLTFTAGADKIYVGDVVDTKHQDRLAFNANNLYMTIPDCKVGDIITFNANRATSASATKFTCIQAMGGAIAPDGFVSSTGVQDSVQLGSSFASFKFKAQVDGDITFLVSQCLLKSVTIEEGIAEVPCTYSVVAAYTAEDGTVTVLKQLVGEAEEIAGSTVKANYPYWLADAAGNVYTHGAKGSEFVEAFDLKSDTTFVINYAKTAMEGAVYLSEGEDIPGAIVCTHANSAIRSSMGKAGYVLEDTKLVTLQPGTYKIRAIIFDAAKTASHIVTLTKGEGEENEIYLNATATNWTEAESDLLTITEPTDITLKAGGNEEKGLDVIVIYAASDDLTDAIVDVEAGAQKAAVRKVLKGGQIVFETEAGTFNTAGVQVK